MANKIPNFPGLITTPKFNRFAKTVIYERIKIVTKNLPAKVDITNACDLGTKNQKNTDNLSYLLSKNYFSCNGFQNNLIFYPLLMILRLRNVDNLTVNSWKSLDIST